MDVPKDWVRVDSSDPRDEVYHWKGNCIVVTEFPEHGGYDLAVSVSLLPHPDDPSRSWRHPSHVVCMYVLGNLGLDPFLKPSAVGHAVHFMGNLVDG